MDYIEMDKIRTKLGWSKRELAKRLGIHERTVHGYIRGEEKIPLSIQKLIDAFEKGYRPKEE